MNFRPRFRKASRSDQGWIRRVRLGVMSVLAVGLLGGGLYVWQQRENFGPGLTDMVARASGATVAEIMVSGVTHTSRADLAAALQLQQGDPLVSFTPAVARARLEALPWIHAAAVARQLPNKVVVDVFEHQPVARVAVGEDDIWVVNKAGDMIVPAAPEFEALPLLTGPGAEMAAAGLFQLLQDYPNFMAQVQQAIRQGERRWDLKFKSGVMVQLPAEDAAQALEWLQALEEKRHVLTLAQGEVDLRLADRITLRIPPEAEAEVVLGATQNE